MMKEEEMHVGLMEYLELQKLSPLCVMKTFKMEKALHIHVHNGKAHIYIHSVNLFMVS